MHHSPGGMNHPSMVEGRLSFMSVQFTSSPSYFSRLLLLVQSEGVEGVRSVLWRTRRESVALGKVRQGKHYLGTLEDNLLFV